MTDDPTVDRWATTTRRSCGTRRGYGQHLDAGELPCVPCIDAHLTDERALRAD